MVRGYSGCICYGGNVLLLLYGYPAADLFSAKPVGCHCACFWYDLLLLPHTAVQCGLLYTAGVCTGGVFGFAALAAVLLLCPICRGGTSFSAENGFACACVWGAVWRVILHGAWISEKQRNPLDRQKNAAANLFNCIRGVFVQQHQQCKHRYAVQQQASRRNFADSYIGRSGRHYDAVCVPSAHTGNNHAAGK